MKNSPRVIRTQANIAVYGISWNELMFSSFQREEILNDMHIKTSVIHCPKPLFLIVTTPWLDVKSILIGSA